MQCSEKGQHNSDTALKVRWSLRGEQLEVPVSGEGLQRRGEKETREERGMDQSKLDKMKDMKRRGEKERREERGTDQSK